jgi:exopolysaccharide production protein ExoY
LVLACGTWCGNMRTQYSLRTSPPDIVNNPPEQNPLGGPWKRSFDVTVGGIALMTLTPMLLTIAGLIRLLLGTPIIVAEERIGYKGRRFKCYAFRTTGENTNRGQDALWRRRPYFSFWVNAFGQALHASGLEELPRLINVVRGDMSLIGPRPIAGSELLKYSFKVPEYFFARPGVTGIWRHADWHRSRLAVDRYYFRYWSMRLDLALLIKAICANSSNSTVGLEGRRVTAERRHLT